MSWKASLPSIAILSNYFLFFFYRRSRYVCCSMMRVFCWKLFARVSICSSMKRCIYFLGLSLSSHQKPQCPHTRNHKVDGGENMEKHVVLSQLVPAVTLIRKKIKPESIVCTKQCMFTLRKQTVLSFLLNPDCLRAHLWKLSTQAFIGFLGLQCLYRVFECKFDQICKMEL